MLTTQQAQAIADVLLASGAAKPFDIRCGLVEHLTSPTFSEWRLDHGKLFISGGNIWVAGRRDFSPRTNAIMREANSRLAEAVTTHKMPLQVTYAHYRKVAPLSAAMAEQVWQAINDTTPLDAKRKARFINEVTTKVDSYVYVPTRNRRLGLNWGNDNFGFYLEYIDSYAPNRPRLLDASVKMRELFNAHCHEHNL